VFDAAAVYSGPQSAAGPDSSSSPSRGSTSRIGQKKEVFGGRLEGMHTWDDAFLWSESKVADDLSDTTRFAAILVITNENQISPQRESGSF